MENNMTFAEYLKNLQELAEQRPEVLNFKVVFSTDDEGNSYDPIYYTPTVGYHFEDCFVSETQLNEMEPEDREEYKDINAVCIN
jgi:hypothetical protein